MSDPSTGHPPLSLSCCTLYRLPDTLHDVNMGEPQDTDDPETCPLCVETGAPKPPKVEATSETALSTSAGDADAPDLQWIACSKCGTWMHSVCVVSSSTFRDASIPPSLRTEIDSSGEGVWYDWASRVDRWYVTA